MSGYAASPAAADQSWQNYRYLADGAIDVVLEADLETVITWISPSAEDVLGWRPVEVVGKAATDLVHPDDMPEIGMLVQSLNERAARVGTRRCRMLTKGGSFKPMQLRGRPALADDGSVVGHVITMQDTSERDDALRALAVLSEGNRVLARVNDEDGLLQGMCDAIVATGGFPLAWYGRKVDDAEHSVERAAVAGPSRVYADTITVTWDDGPLGQGPTGTAIRTGTTQVRHSFADNAQFAPWREAAEEASLRSSVCLPVRSRGVVDGALMVYASEAHAFDVRAVELLETLASDLGLGLDRLRSLQDLQLRTAEAKEQNARLRGVFDSQFDPFVLLETIRDESGAPLDLRYVAMSDATLDFNQLSREQMIGHTITELFPGQVTDGSLASYFDVIETGVPIVMDDFEYFHEPRQELVRLDIRAVKSGDGIAITFRDVTARAEAVQRLAESEARYRLLAENSSDVIWETQGGGVLVWSSESVTSVLGWLPDEVIGRGLDLVHPDDLRAQESSLTGIIRGLTVEGEARIAHRDGSWRWMSYSVHRVETDGRTVDIVALRDINDEVIARTALDHAMGHDPLTGMAARPAMLQRIGEILGNLRGRRLAAVLCVGVDRLAAINEAYTHAAGDLVLTALATRIAEATGKPDLIGRGTGVEFIVAIQDLVSGDEAARLADHLLAVVKPPVVFGDIVIEPTVSIGIAIGDRSSDREQLARDASAAMGQAKADGRDRYVFADASMADQARHRLDVERRIRESLEDDRFRAFFQPVVDLSTGELAGYESLVRIERADGTIAPPSHFLPIAELTPVIADIDLIMLRRGLVALSVLPEPLTVAVNLSTVTLTRPGYSQLIERTLRESDARRARLHLEVTETALLGETAQIVAAMESIASLGPRWYVDDFGTGYSSISHLRDLPVSGLKLDVSFSAGIRDGDQKSIRLAQALAGLAGGLGLDTVAEGIETAEEALLLRAQGWRHGQGWLYGRPEPLP